jgi:uncharacterized membrane protein YoaK (UPF0700 family)
MIILSASLLFLVLLYHSNKTNESTESWIKHTIAAGMFVCGVTIGYAVIHDIGLLTQLLGSMVFVAISSAAWPIKSDDDGGS